MRDKQWYNEHRYRLSKGLAETDSWVARRNREEHLSERFIDLMKNRGAFASFRYGRWQDHKRNGKKFKMMTAMKQRVDEYIKTGNQDYLADIANYAMLEFEVPEHDGAHMAPVDDGTHCTEM